VTPQGHLVSAQGIGFFAPDSELHGVLARQRELAELAHAIDAAKTAATAARAALTQVSDELEQSQRNYHDESLAFASQQRRCHDLDLELMQLKQAAEVAAARRAQIVQEQEELAAQETVEREQSQAIGAEIADAQSRLHDELAKRELARQSRNDVDAAMARGRERVRVAERVAQEAAFAERSGRERLAEMDRRREGLTAQVDQQQGLLAQLGSERAAIDWTPVEEALQRQLAARGAAEQALAAARDKLEGLGVELRAAEEARLEAEHSLVPARAKIEEMRLKEQAAALAEQQFAEQLSGAQADLAVLPDLLKAFGNKSALPGEIERLQKAILDLGAVNLAALDEVATAQERKAYLDAQSADLTEAMATLENAIRQIDRESRHLLQQTFDTVNENFARLFPMLFGGGQAKLVLTGEEILDSGVQVIAQPPGKRKTSIHLLSGGEKALTAISLGVRAVSAQSGTVLPARRSGCAPRSIRTPTLLPDGAGHGARNAILVHFAQQDHDGNRQPAHWHYDAGPRDFTRRGRGYRRGVAARGNRRCLIRRGRRAVIPAAFRLSGVARYRRAFRA
jgi:chromosome segregation protein